MIIANADLFGRICDLRVEGDLITEVADVAAAGPLSRPGNGELLDAGGRTLLPGLIDPHVHFRCPGAERKEDWISGASAAVAGGVTTVFDMPNTNPPTETLRALDLKRRAAEEAEAAGLPVGRLFWAGCSPDNIEELPKLLREPDVAGVKLFLCASSGNRSCADPEFLIEVFETAEACGKPAAVHSEHPELLAAAPHSGLPGLRGHNAARPAAAAEAGTKLTLFLASQTGCRLYLCHLSTAAEFRMVREHKALYGADSVIAELTPHHLLLSEEHEVAGGPQSWAKVNPPLRTWADNRAAAEALLDGTVDLIGSDHAPHLPKEKAETGPDGFGGCPSGFPGLETELGAVAGFLKANCPEDWQRRAAELMSGKAARIFGLGGRGKIAEGMRADLVILGDDGIVDPALFKTKAAYSPFSGMRQQASVYKTILRGRIYG